MIKKILTVFAVFTLLFVLSCPILAAETEENANTYYSEVWNTIDGQTRELMRAIGVDGTDFNSILSLTPDSVIKLIKNLFSSELTSPFKSFFLILGVMLTVSLALSFADASTPIGEAAENIGIMCIVFTVAASTVQITADCRSAIELSKDFMLGLIPVLAGVIAFAGNPMLALSYNTVVFSFAEVVSVIFCNSVPVITAVGMAVSAAGTINPAVKTSGFSELFNKAASLIMGLLSAVFVGVLSVRGVVAAAADTVTVKGLRFLIGNAVPIVGSAIGDALTSITAGLGLIKNSIGALSILSLLLISLPAVCTLLVWRVMLYLLQAAADMMGLTRAGSFISAVNSLFKVLTAVICFNMFVYIMCTLIVLVVKAQ